jgi:transcriptional regulator with GAF, ATPase, and Fis domain
VRSGWRATTLRDLRAVGIDVVATAVPDPSVPVLLFFDVVAPEVLARVRDLDDGGLVRVLAVRTDSGSRSRPNAWEILEAGASDVLDWEADQTGRSILARLGRWHEVDRLVESPIVQDSLVGRGPQWLVLLREIVEVARFTDASVLITGESGTGKELVARLIHELDPRRDKRNLVLLDCTTVVPTLSGSEFFGHERGAFTGATGTREGAFASADGGTLFLDEVGDLALPLQAELLRVIQEGMYKRVGSDTWRSTRFRLVCATNRDLREEQRHGRFRSDLYYRIAEWTFALPALRERATDIPLLVRTFLRQAHPKGDRLEIDDAVLRLLCDRDYEGNVRDLRQAVFRIAKRHVGEGPISVGEVPPDERPPASAATADVIDGGSRGMGIDGSLLTAAVEDALAAGETLRQITRRAAETAIRIALADAGSPGRAAQRLGITPRALQLRRASRPTTRGREGDGSTAQPTDGAPP